MKNCWLPPTSLWEEQPRWGYILLQQRGFQDTKLTLVLTGKLELTAAEHGSVEMYVWDSVSAWLLRYVCFCATRLYVSCLVYSSFIIPGLCSVCVRDTFQSSVVQTYVYHESVCPSEDTCQTTGTFSWAETGAGRRLSANYQLYHI